jgi:hypothetical protein
LYRAATAVLLHPCIDVACSTANQAGAALTGAVTDRSDGSYGVAYAVTRSGAYVLQIAFSGEIYRPSQIDMPVGMRMRAVSLHPKNLRISN